MAEKLRRSPRRRKSTTLTTWHQFPPHPAVVKQMMRQNNLRPPPRKWKSTNVITNASTKNSFLAPSTINGETSGYPLVPGIGVSLISTVKVPDTNIATQLCTFAGEEAAVGADMILATENNPINSVADMDCYEEIEFKSEAYTSIWLIHNLISGCKEANLIKSDDIEEIEYVLKNLHIFLVRNKKSSDINDDAKFLDRGKFKGKLIPASQKEALSSDKRRPFAVVFMLRVEGRHGECFLNVDDAALLDNAKKFICQMKDVVYILKYGIGHKETYDETDLHKVSEEIQTHISGKNSRNRIFPKLFFMHDEQIHIRIGLCLHKSILCHLKQIFAKIERVRQEFETDFTLLSRLQAIDIEIMKDMTEMPQHLCKEFRNNLFITRRIAFDALIDLLSRKDFASIRSLNLGKNSDVFRDRIRKMLDKYPIQLTSPYPRYITRSKARQLRCYGGSSKKKRKSKGIESKAVDVRNKILLSIVKADFRKSLKTISKSVKKTTDKLSGLCQNIQEEFTKRGDNVALHEFKIVSERNPQVKGFGYVGENITINISRDDESCKKEVWEYLKKYLDVEDYRVSIVWKKRKFTPFSNLEQGSRINRENAKKYGTLGMFFQDNEETYFFTTCAHVIGKNAFAYSHTDNTRIGKNVFVFDSGSGIEDSQDTHMDFSLIEVSPERNLTCSFGLKTLTGNFIEGHIFHGDLSEIRHRTLYKWGATKPYFRKGKCLGCNNDGTVLSLQTDTPHFAGPGDSGAIICIGDDPKLGLAAFVLVGGDIEDETGVAVYKVSEAIDKVSELRREITPCLIPFQKSINISESTRKPPPTAQKRKVKDDLSEGGQKRRSPSKLD